MSNTKTKREKKRAYNKAYYEAHREEIQTRMKTYREIHREALRTQNRGLGVFADSPELLQAAASYLKHAGKKSSRILEVH